MEKLQVGKEMFDALEDFTLRHRTISDLSTGFTIHTNGTGWVGDWRILNNLTIGELAHAVYVGYELLESREQKLVRYFNSFDYTPQGEPTERVVIRKTLEILDKKVKGIN